MPGGYCIRPGRDRENSLFLDQGELIFGGVRNLLEEQFARLSPQGQSLLMWLAVLPEPANLDELTAIMDESVPRSRLLEALEALYRRSLIEQGQTKGSFALQVVVRESGSKEGDTMVNSHYAIGHRYCSSQPRLH